MTSLSDVKQAEIIEAFKSTSRYLDDLLNIDTIGHYLSAWIAVKQSWYRSPIFRFAFVYFKRICFI